MWRELDALARAEAKAAGGLKPWRRPVVADSQLGIDECAVGAVLRGRPGTAADELLQRIAEVLGRAGVNGAKLVNGLRNCHRLSFHRACDGMPRAAAKAQAAAAPLARDRQIGGKLPLDAGLAERKYPNNESPEYHGP